MRKSSYCTRVSPDTIVVWRDTELGLGGVPKIAKNAKEPGAQIRSQLGTLRGLDAFAGRSNTCEPVIHGLADCPR
jgi:hypothetical protein